MVVAFYPWWPCLTIAVHPMQPLRNCLLTMMLGQIPQCTISFLMDKIRLASCKDRFQQETSCKLQHNFSPAQLVQDYIKPIKYKRLWCLSMGKSPQTLGLWFGHCLVPYFWVETAWSFHIVLFGDAATGVSKKKPRSATQRWWSLRRMALPKERRPLSQK